MVEVNEVMRKLETWGNPDEVNSSILNYLGFVDKGPTEEVISPMLPRDLGKITEMYEQALINEDEWMIPFSESEREKFKPRSAYQGFSEFRDRAYEQWTHEPNWSPSQYRGPAVDMVARFLGARNSLRAMTFDRALDRIERATNSGAFLFTRRSKILDDFENRARLLEITRLLRDGVVEPGQYIIATRAKEGRLDQPTTARVVYMGPIHETLFCATIQAPLQEHLRMIPSFPSMQGPIQDDKALANILNDTGGYQILSGDISNFDSSVHVNKLHEVEYIYRRLFQSREYVRLATCFECCREGGVLTPEGFWPTTGHGIKSGWTLTNQVDSIINLVDLTSNFLTLGINILDGKLPYPIVNGDDFVVNMRGVSIKELSEVSLLHGMEMHPEKQLVSDSVASFNARYMKRGDNFSVRPGWRHARAMAFPERNPNLDAKGWAMRSIAILGLITTNRAYMDCLKLEIANDKKFYLGSTTRTVLNALTSEENVEAVSEAMGWGKDYVPSSLRYGPGTFETVVRDLASFSGS